MPALLVCPCFINFPTFCERPSRQTVFIPPTLLSQHPLHCTEAPAVLMGLVTGRFLLVDQAVLTMC